MAEVKWYHRGPQAVAALYPDDIAGGPARDLESLLFNERLSRVSWRHGGASPARAKYPEACASAHLEYGRALRPGESPVYWFHRGPQPMVVNFEEATYWRIWSMVATPPPDDGGSAYTGPLDELPDAAIAFDQYAPSAAWLAGTNTYATLRRDSDDDEETFQHESDGSPPTAAIVAWRDAMGAATAYGVTWNDGSGNNTFVTNADPASQPAWTESGPNGKPSFINNGATFDFLQSATNITIPSAQATLIAVGRLATVGNRCLLGINGGEGLGWFGVYINGDGKVEVHIVDATAENEVTFISNSSVAATVENYFVMSVKIDATSPSIKINNSAIALTNNSFGTVGSFSERIVVGGDDPGSGTWDGEITAEYLWPALESDAGILAVTQMLATRYNITLP